MPGGTPRFVSVFDPYRCIFVFVDKMAEKNINQSKQIFLPVFTCFYLFYFIDFDVGNCNNFDLLRYYSL